jgi:hypothetical protein
VTPLDPHPSNSLTALRWLKPLVAGGILVVLFCVSLSLYTRNNHFPMRYHPDESGKVDQILSPRHLRNYHHPQLLLEVSDQLLKVWPTDDPQQAVQIGRTASALCAALTVVAAALLGYCVAGFAGLFILAAFLLVSSPMIIYSHYMKEDASLMLGLVLCLLASRVYWGKNRTRTPESLTNDRVASTGRSVWFDLAAVALMGIACAVATSGKYVGVYTVATLLPLLFFPRGRYKLIPLRLLIFVLATVAVTLLINHLIFQDWNGFTRSLEAETHHGMTEHFDLAMDVPTTFFILNTWETASTPVRVFAVLYLPLLLITWKRRSGWGLFPIFFLAVSTAVIARCPIPFPRYGLPMVVTLYVMAGLTGCFAVDWAESIVGRLARRSDPPRSGRSIAGALVATVVVAFALASQIPLAGDYLDQFGHDSRQGLRDWLLKNGQPGATIAADFYAGLRDDGRPQHSSDEWHGFRIEPSYYGFAPQVVGWGNLRDVRYVAICDIAYERYTVPQAHGYGDRAYEFNVRKEFYRKLIDHCTPVWKSVPKHPMHAYTNPTIYLYDTTKLPDDIR